MSKIYGSGIIYVRSRAKTKDIAEQLKSQGFSADYYHAGLPTEEKRDKQDKWKRGEIRIIVATNAFGMGIDKPNVRFVMHLMFRTPSKNITRKRDARDATAKKHT